MLIDSHCHLDLLSGELKPYLVNARQNGVFGCISVCVDLSSFPTILKIAETHDNIYCTAGVHPSEKIPPGLSSDMLVKMVQHPKVVAIGETGLDYHYGDRPKEQQELFRLHIQAAKKAKKPLVIHLRDADKDLLDIMKEENARDAGGVMHCFTSTKETAYQLLDWGFFIGLSGIVTFPKAAPIREVIKTLPLSRILLETDSPFLAPLPKRGTRNEPAFLKHTAEYLAKFLGVDFEALAKRTTDNIESFLANS